MGFNKEIIIPNGPGACSRLRSTPLVPNAVKPDLQRVRTHWNRGFIAFQRVQRALL
jgi:hypothetical protein